jgi:chromosome partitioning protein
MHVHGATRLAREVSHDVEQCRTGRTCWSEAQPFATRIRRNIRLAEAPSFGQSIFDYAPASNGADDYRRLVMEVAEQLARA